MRLGLYEAELAAGLDRRASCTARPRHPSATVTATRSTTTTATGSPRPGWSFSGVSPDRSLVEYVELPREVHPFYVGTQAHPELRSRPNRAHPLFRGLVAAALERKRASRLFEVAEPGRSRVADDEVPWSRIRASRPRPPGRRAAEV